MSVVKLLNSIKIQMYFFDHLPPHFHAEYAEYEEVFQIDGLSTLVGQLPKKQRAIVISWAQTNQDFLNQKWNEFNQQ